MKKKQGELTAIKNRIISGEYEFAVFLGFLDNIDKTLNSIEQTIYLSKRLIKRSDEILSMDPSWGRLKELKTILETNDSLLTKAESAQSSVNEVYTLMKKEIAIIKSQKDENSDMRADSSDKSVKGKAKCSWFKRCRRRKDSTDSPSGTNKKK